MHTHASVREVNFDCLVGPTYHFGGLSLGNLSSTSNSQRQSNPKKAALQGLEKMRLLAQKGFSQCILPPQERPHYPTLRRLGFSPLQAASLANIYVQAPEIFSSVCSSSFMWAANAATVCPKSDALDNKCHFTPANLVTMFHRSIEVGFTTKILRKIFHDKRLFQVHEALPMQDLFSDEGAANHNRLAPEHSNKGLQIFVYGKDDSMLTKRSRRFPARQSKQASSAIARLHALDPENCIIIAQNPHAIDRGAFHNDVVCVTNEDLMLCHAEAFVNQTRVLKDINERYERLFGQKAHIIEISSEELSLDDAVSSYLFNSQILSKASGSMLLFAPADCLASKRAQALIEKILQGPNPIDEVLYFDVSESMANGGGPACLRLRVVLDELEYKSIEQGVIFSNELFARLQTIIERHYVDRLTMANFFDEKFLQSANEALDEISEALGLGAIYDFQR